MARDYIIHRMADVDEDVDAEDYLARTVYEQHELIDIGILNPDGNRVLARKRPDTIGFVRWRS